MQAKKIYLDIKTYFEYFDLNPNKSIFYEIFIFLKKVLAIASEIISICGE